MKEDEVLEAERSRALELLDKLEAMIARVGGMMSHEDQRLIRQVRALLEETGTRRSVAPKIWTDRQCVCVRHAGRLIVSKDCEIHKHQRER